MIYSNGNSFIHVFFNRGVIRMDNIDYKMRETRSENEEKSKFAFNIYTVKIVNNRLSLYDAKTSVLVKTYVKEYNQTESVEKSNMEDSDNGWDSYMIKRDKYLNIDKSRTVVVLNEENFTIKSTHKLGNCDMYITENNGTLMLSDKVNTWNGVSIMKI